MTRAKLTGLRRNLAVAIGNTGDPRRLLRWPKKARSGRSADDEMVLEHIRWAVTRATI